MKQFLNCRSTVHNSRRSIYLPGTLRKVKLMCIGKINSDNSYLLLQHTKKTFKLKDVPLVSHKFSTLLSVGGNLHNDLVESDATVSQYKSVVAAGTEKYKLSHIGDYVAYVTEEKVRLV